MTLRDLLHGVTADPVAAIPVSGLARHSKQVRPGDCFVAIRGASVDGHAYIEEAITRGAAAVVAERLPRQTSRPCPCVVVRDARHALAVMAARFYGHPSRKLRLIGVTGTNGKTTTTYLIKRILDTLHAPCGLLGTIVYQIGSREIPSSNTTPGPLELQRYFAQMVGEGIEWCTMEISSHALDQRRIEGLELQAAILTNLGSDHLDYHKTREAYGAAKRRIFDALRPDGLALVNGDDDFGRLAADTLPRGTAVTFGLERPARVAVRDIRCTWQGSEAALDTPWGTLTVRTPLLGRHNLYNVAAAAAATLGLGVETSVVRQGLAALDQVPGRLEPVPNDFGFRVLIDYAHTADALRLVLSAVRELTPGRLLIVFGCGGDRDQSKRPVMGRLASQLADYVVLTSDNPRHEDPMDIIRQIASGFVPSFQHFQVQADREQAIVTALALARPEDTVLLAGKGHEAYQIFQNVSIPFVDRDVVERWLTVRQHTAVSLGAAA